MLRERPHLLNPIRKMQDEAWEQDDPQARGLFQVAAALYDVAEAIKFTESGAQYRWDQEHDMPAHEEDSA